jgi:putative ABC transport system ATP-binding protein
MLRVRNATKTYRKPGRTIHAVQNLSVDIDPGEFIVVHGPSGSGKSTLLLLLGAMLPPEEGEVLFDSDSIYRWSPGRRNRFRKQTVGFVFQRYFLIPYLTVLDNIRLSLAIQGNASARRDDIDRLTSRLRITDRLGHRPSELSAGEQQRAAVARALVGDKTLILADEPTGNLDTPNAQIIAACLAEERERGRAIVVVTHDPSLRGIGTRELQLVEGRLVEPAEAEPEAV